MTEAGANLALVVGAWTAMSRSGSTDALASILDDDVVWQGLRPELVCRNRTDVLDLISRHRGTVSQVTQIEAAEFGDRVAVSVRGPSFADDGLLPKGAPRSLVFTFRDGRVVRMDSLASRDAAFELAAR